MADLSRLLAAMIALQATRPGQPSIVAKYAAREELQTMRSVGLSPAEAAAVRTVDDRLGAFRFERPDLTWEPLWRAYEDLEVALGDG